MDKLMASSKTDNDSKQKMKLKFDIKPFKNTKLMYSMLCIHI